MALPVLCVFPFLLLELSFDEGLIVKHELGLVLELLVQLLVNDRPRIRLVLPRIVNPRVLRPDYKLSFESTATLPYS